MKTILKKHSCIRRKNKDCKIMYSDHKLSVSGQILSSLIHTPFQIYCDLIFILFGRLLLGGSTAELLTPIPYIYFGFINKKNKRGTAHLSEVG